MEALRRLAPYLSAAVIIVLLYDGYIFFERWKSRRDAEIAAREYEADQARKVIQRLGGAGLKIQHYYAAPPEIRKGESARLCYSVTGAKTVRLQPPVEQLHPALSYCFAVKPARDTDYVLTATSETGESISQTVIIRVQ